MARAGGAPLPTITDDRVLGAVDIQRSLRFNRGDAPYLQATLGNGDEDKWTWSGWVKKTVNGQHQNLFSSGSDVVYTHINFDNSDRIRFQNWHSAQKGTKITTRKIRDHSSWMHIVVIWDSGNSTADDRMRIYVNGTRETDFSSSTNPDQNQDSVINGNSLGGSDYGEGKHFIGKFADTSDNSGTYKAEINFVDGYAYDPSYFGFTDSQTGIWMPKRYEGVYGSNGFYLDFSDNSSTTTLGIDKSPNGNDFTLNNFAVSDSVKDTPTNAFATLNANVYADSSFNEGSLYFDAADTHKTAYSTIAVSSGKWYWETKAMGGSLTKWTYGVDDVKNIGVGQISGTNRLLAVEPSAGYAYGDAVSIYNTNLYKNGSVVTSSYQTATSTGDIIGVALDVDAGKVWFARNGTWINGSASASTTLNPASHDTTVTTGETYVPAISGESADWQLNFGQDDSFSGTSTSQGNEDENGLGSFYYAVPSGFRALCTKNLPPNVPSIIRPQRHFDVLTWTGNGSTGQNITGLEFKPDLLWIKKRNESESWGGYDSVRGVNKRLYINDVNVEQTITTLSAFSHGGFRVEGSGGGATNDNNDTYVGFCWKAGGATTVANTDGDQTTQVSVNEEAGLSIVTYTGTGSNTNIGHGLGGTPDIVMTKSRSATGSWAFLDRIGNSTAEYGLFLNDNGGYSSYQGGTYWNDTLPTSTVFRVSSNAATNASGVTYVAYCWRSIPGFSKFGTYKGNGITDGSFIHTGFRPAWVMFKRTDSGGNWFIVDSKRDLFNECTRDLYPNNSNAETNNPNFVDFLSNGFKLRTTGTAVNASGGTYIYMAFAEQPDMTPFDVFPNAR